MSNLTTPSYFLTCAESVNPYRFPSNLLSDLPRKPLDIASASMLTHQAKMVHMVHITPAGHQHINTVSPTTLGC